MSGRVVRWLALVAVLALALVACARHVDMRPKGQLVTGISVGG